MSSNQAVEVQITFEVSCCGYLPKSSEKWGGVVNVTTIP